MFFIILTISISLIPSSLAINVDNSIQVAANTHKILLDSNVDIIYEIEQSGKAQGALKKSLPIGGALLMLILVLQFGNVRKMLIILTTIPLSFIGVVLGLYTVNYPLSFFGILGVLSLAGIVVNNAILLIEQTDANLEAGMPPTQALIESGLRRSYPIVLTTVSTLAGLYTLAISGLFWGPLAVAIMGGLIVSTFLTHDSWFLGCWFPDLGLGVQAQTQCLN